MVGARIDVIYTNDIGTKSLYKSGIDLALASVYQRIPIVVPISPRISDACPFSAQTGCDKAAGELMYL